MLTLTTEELWLLDGINIAAVRRHVSVADDARVISAIG
ncbi:hypothetical protein ABIF99_002617 [Bradyrhizobium japonicum]